jgi:putative tryptophan/tyrosine transport system substrate-binding protein
MKTAGVPSILVAVVLLALGVIAEAQQPKKVPRIGFLSGGGDPVETEAFRQGLRELGYIEGKTIVIENRYIQGTVNSIPSVVAGLVQLKVDVLVLGSIGAVRAAKQATKTIPIVMVITVDPVATGIVDSFARPGGNITGLATLNRELGGKRLELFKEMAPTISRIGVLADADGEASAIGFRAYEAAASVLNVQLQSLEVRGPNPDLEGAFQVATKGRANALITIGNPLINSYRKRIIDLQ